jgi:hypothetical protein
MQLVPTLFLLLFLGLFWSFAPAIDNILSVSNRMSLELFPVCMHAAAEHGFQVVCVLFVAAVGTVCVRRACHALRLKRLAASTLLRVRDGHGSWAIPVGRGLWKGKPCLFAVVPALGRNGAVSLRQMPFGPQQLRSVASTDERDAACGQWLEISRTTRAALRVEQELRTLAGQIGQLSKVSALAGTSEIHGGSARTYAALLEDAHRSRQRLLDVRRQHRALIREQLVGLQVLRHPPEHFETPDPEILAAGLAEEYGALKAVGEAYAQLLEHRLV